MYKREAKYTLMANSPRGDIELLFQSSTPPPPHDKIYRKRELTDYINSQTPSMRLRFSRQRQLVEIARYVQGSQGGEWTKKVLPAMDKNLAISMEDWTGLEDSEWAGISCLIEFLSVCEEIERLDEESRQPISSAFADGHPVQACGKKLGREPIAVSTLQNAPSARPPLEENGSSSTTIAKSLASVLVAPRPPKLGPAPAVSWQSGGMNEVEVLKGVLSSTGDITAGRNKTASAGVAQMMPGWCPDDPELTTEGHGIQTRFIPSVGWCIRYGSRVSQGGRYRIMFLDGVSLDIDVDEEWVELTSRSGDVTR
jgi:polo-like kinase 4